MSRGLGACATPGSKARTQRAHQRDVDRFWDRLVVADRQGCVGPVDPAQAQLRSRQNRLIVCLAGGDLIACADVGVGCDPSISQECANLI